MVAVPQEVIELTYGPMVSAMMVQQLLLGILCVQVFDYSRTFPKDPVFYKSLVWASFVINVFLGATNFHLLYRVTVTNYGDFEAFDLQPWTSWVEPPATAIVGLLAQIFFLERCYRATNSWPITIILLLMILTSFGCGIATTVAYVSVQRLSLIALVPTPITAWLISTAVTDISIALVLIWGLIRSKTPFKKTEQVIYRIVRLSMETSGTTAVVALINLIFYYAFPTAAYIMLPQLAMARIYTSAVLVTLASRTEIRNILFGDGHTSYASRGAAPVDKNLQLQNIKVTTTVAHERVRSWQDQTDIELGPTTSNGPHDDNDTSFGESKAVVL